MLDPEIIFEAAQIVDRQIRDRIHARVATEPLRPGVELASIERDGPRRAASAAPVGDECVQGIDHNHLPRRHE